MKNLIKTAFTRGKNIGRRTLLLALGSAMLFSVAGLKAAPAEPALDNDHPKIREAMGLQNAMTPGLMKVDGILGTATGADENGEVTIVVYVNKNSPKAPGIIAGMPKNAKNVPITVEVTEPFRALGKPVAGGKPAPAPTVSHTAKQAPPIKLGTSGGWGGDSANGYCCGGTLGSLITVNGEQYILSNYHVFESDIVLGGNGIMAETGSSIIQPGLIDVGCNAASAQTVATLVKKSSLPNNNVDASIALVTPGMVSQVGEILEIGTISASTVGASLNQAVKKSGRTTKLTRSKVAGLNATISVAYDNECAGGAAFTKTFTGQILISNRRSGFLAGGDSGSLMVEDLATNPRAVGLLFAGSNTIAVANPINEVLAFFGATMVGQ
jgi:hypothetical protein